MRETHCEAHLSVESSEAILLREKSSKNLLITSIKLFLFALNFLRFLKSLLVFWIQSLFIVGILKLHLGKLVASTYNMKSFQGIQGPWIYIYYIC